MPLLPDDFVALDQTEVVLRIEGEHVLHPVRGDMQYKRIEFGIERNGLTELSSVPDNWQRLTIMFVVKSQYRAVATQLNYASLSRD
jgi:hypothetical protein